MRRFDICDNVPKARGRKLFSVAEANRSLVLVKRVVGDIVTEYSRLLDLQEMIDAAQAGGTGPEPVLSRERLLEAVERLRVCMQELEDLGVELKDWSLGIVDYPSVMDGREVRLCWQYGEGQVSHWYEIGADFAVRQPVEAKEPVAASGK